MSLGFKIFICFFVCMLDLLEEEEMGLVIFVMKCFFFVEWYVVIGKVFSDCLRWDNKVSRFILLFIGVIC